MKNVLSSPACAGLWVCMALGAHAATPAHRPEPLAALRQLQDVALPGHPLARAAARRARQAAAERDGADAVFDTRLRAVGGSATWARAVPGPTPADGIGANRSAIEAGVERALRPGVIVAAGVAARYLDEATPADEGLYQSLAGLQVRVPLWRNRGLAAWRLETAGADARRAAAEADALAVIQALRFESAIAYIDLLHAAADLAAYERAGDRVRTLIDDAEVMMEMEVIPVYQIHQVRMEAALRDEDLAAAEHRRASFRLYLENLLGALDTLPLEAPTLLAWAAVPAPPAAAPDRDDAARRRGDAIEAAARVEAARADARAARDGLRPDFSLRLAATWQAEDPDGPLGRAALIDGRETGFEAVLVLETSIERRREQAAWRAAQARADEWEAHADEARRRLALEGATAGDAARQARRRLDLMTAAVVSATHTLEAERERFRLGENLSRNVLDAQKDVTAVELRRNAAAAALLRAGAALDYAAGYPDAPRPGSETPRQESTP